MEWSSTLCLLVEVIEAGNLSAAARKLKTSRANVSYHLGKLEASVGHQLLRRTTRRLEATEIGLRLYEHGRRIQNELSAAREAVMLLGETLRGRIRLSVPCGYGQLVMGDWLLDFKRHYPDIALDVVFENHVDDLLRDGIDIAVRIISKPPQLLVARELGPVRYVACASRDYAARRGLPATPEALREVPLITSLAMGRPLRMFAHRGPQRQEVVLETSLSSENFMFLRDAIYSGLGVGLVPDYVVQKGVLDGQILTALNDYHLSIFGSRMYMLYMPNRHQTLSISTFIEYMLDHARQYYRRQAPVAALPLRSCSPTHELMP